MGTEDCKKLVDEFGGELVSETLTQLWRGARNFSKARKVNGVEINEFKIDMLVVGYLGDISRIKSFHGIETVNDCKRVAYKVYWWLRNAPFQVSNANTDEKARYINEAFAANYAVAIGVLRAASMDFDDLDEDSRERVGRFISVLEYFFRYRSYTPQSIELMLEAFRTGQALSLK